MLQKPSATMKSSQSLNQVKINIFGPLLTFVILKVTWYLLITGNCHFAEKNLSFSHCVLPYVEQIQHYEHICPWQGSPLLLQAFIFKRFTREASKKCNIWALGHTHKPSYHLVFRTIFLVLTFLGVSTFSQKVEFRLTSLPFALLGSSTKFDHFPIPFKNITDRLLKYDKQTYVDTWYVGG